MTHPAKIRAQILIVLLGVPALWLASTITSPARWTYVGVVAVVLIVCEVLVLRFIPFQSKHDRQAEKNHDG
jgi:hypothetical protein